MQCGRAGLHPDTRGTRGETASRNKFGCRKGLSRRRDRITGKIRALGEPHPTWWVWRSPSNSLEPARQWSVPRS
jgi:hypothetical protein